MKSHNIDTTCPWCGRRNELHAEAEQDPRPPRTGDFSICWRCRNVSVFDDEDGVMTLRKPTDEEALDMVTTRINRILGAVREAYTPSQTIKLLKGRDYEDPTGG